jgi:hypothetical protein
VGALLFEGAHDSWADSEGHGRWVDKLPHPLPTSSLPPREDRDLSAFREKPLIPPEIKEYFLRPGREFPPSGRIIYRPQAVGVCKLHFADTKAGIDCWKDYSVIAPISEDGGEALWEMGALHGSLQTTLERRAESGAGFVAPPSGALRPKTHAGWEKTLLNYLYQEVMLDILRSPELKLASQPEESEGDFKVRLIHAAHELRDRQVEKLRQSYGPKLSALQERIRRGERKVEREEAQVGQQKIQTAISVGATVLGALFGRRVATSGSVGRATTAMRGAGRVAREKDDVKRAREDLKALEQQLLDLQLEFESQVEKLHARVDPRPNGRREISPPPQEGRYDRPDGRACLDALAPDCREHDRTSVTV